MKKIEIDVSLSLKIIQNEHRLKELFKTTSKRNRNNSTNYKYFNTEKPSDNENISSFKIEYVPKKTGNKRVYDEKDIIRISSQKTMEIEKENTKCIIKVNTSKNSKVSSKEKENKLNKTSKLNLSLNPFINKIRNNPINSFHNHSSGKTVLNRNITSVSYMNLERMMKRFKENEEKINQWIKEEQTKKEIEEIRRCQRSPKINSRSKKINLKIKDSFLLRFQKLEEEKQQKAEILKEFLIKKKMEEKKQKGMKYKSRTKKTNLSTNKKMSQTLNKFHTLNEKRKVKFNLKGKINLRKENKLAFIPKIKYCNKRSTSMAELRRKNYTTTNLFEHLAKMGKYTVEGKNI